MELINLITDNHIKTKRDYSSRAGEKKPVYAAISKRFDFDYWDGSRDTGYGGYIDDGRWKNFAEKLIAKYSLEDNSSILDVGCGKGFLLSEMRKILPGLKLKGIDVSSYAIEHAPSAISNSLEAGNAVSLAVETKSYDLVISINTLHNLELPELVSALKEIERAKKTNAYICVESYRNEEEKWNLMRWQLTCECFYTPKEWCWIFSLAGYTGDYEFIYFE